MRDKTYKYSYRSVIHEHVSKLNVSSAEQKRYFLEVHKFMALCGIIDYSSIGHKKRRKPVMNSPYGEFVQYEINEDGKRGKHLDSYMLNEKGYQLVTYLLKNFITDRYLTKGKIASTIEREKHIIGCMDEELLYSWLQSKKVTITDRANRHGKPFSYKFVYGGITYTYMYQSNLVVSSCEFSPVTKKRLCKKPVWFIHGKETTPLTNKRDSAVILAKIISCYWNLKFGNKVIGWNDTDTNTNRPLISQREQMLLDRIAKLEERLNLDTSTDPKTETPNQTKGVKAKIIQTISEMVSPLKEQKRYKSISLEQIAKEKKQYRKERMQAAYDHLNKRRLLTAKYRPADGWKFDFDKSNIELLYKIDKHFSSVYNTRHRLLNPYRNEDGDIIKELGNKNEKYKIPYGLDKIDYSFKTIFLCEGVYDSCFVKNCLAYSNWILPEEMNKVIQIFRDNGYQIIHILDNFRVEDKGGVKGLSTILRNRTWLQQGDRIFNWSIYSECKDLNEIAMKYELDEIPYQTIIDNSWNEENAREKGIEFIGFGMEEMIKPIPYQTVTIEDTNKEEPEIIPVHENYDDSISYTPIKDKVSVSPIKDKVSTPAIKEYVPDTPINDTDDDELTKLCKEVYSDTPLSFDDMVDDLLNAL